MAIKFESVLKNGDKVIEIKSTEPESCVYSAEIVKRKSGQRFLDIYPAQGEENSGAIRELIGLRAMFQDLDTQDKAASELHSTEALRFKIGAESNVMQIISLSRLPKDLKRPLMQELERIR